MVSIPPCRSPLASKAEEYEHRIRLALSACEAAPRSAQDIYDFVREHSIVPTERFADCHVVRYIASKLEKEFAEGHAGAMAGSGSCGEKVFGERAWHGAQNEARAIGG